jgi:hypothetical protein
VQIVRKIIFYLFIVVSISAAIWGYLKLKDGKKPNVSLVEHIPTDATCIIQTKQFSKLVSEIIRRNLIWNNLLNNQSVLVAQNGIEYLDSLVNSNADIKDIISDNSIYWTVFNKNKQHEHLILFDLKEQNNKDVIESFFSKVFSKDENVSSFNAYFFVNNNQKWIISCIDGIVYLSSDLEIMQRAISLEKESSIAKNGSYQNLLKENGEQLNQVYINHSLTNFFSNNLFKGQSLFNIDVQLNKITFTGINNSSENSILHCIKQQSTGILTNIQFLPFQPDVIQAVSVSDAKLFYSNIETTLSPENTTNNLASWKTLSDSILYDVKSEILDNIDNQIITSSYYFENKLSQMFSIKIKDASKTFDFLKHVSDSIIPINELKVFHVNDKNSQLFMLSNTDLKMQYAYVTDDIMLFFSDNKMLEFYLNAVSTSNLLGKNNLFMDYAEENLLLGCNYLYLENRALIKQNNTASALNSDLFWNSENALTYLSITANNYKNNTQIRINAEHQNKKEGNEQLGSLWSYKSDTTITTQVYNFVNHNTQENELCFQDVLKQLYLLSSTGKLIWKKEITEEIKSKIYTVDVFKNGKNQLLFNTENYLHIIDRNGNYVNGFPVKLPSRATSPITLYDYENTKDFRIFIACADKHIYNYNLYGVKTEGFNSVKTEQEVKLPISYVKVGASDYLITADTEGKIYAFSRKGEGRIDFNNRTIEGLSHLYVLAGNNLDNTKIIYVDDKNNLLNKVSLTDKKETIKIGDELKDYNVSFSLINDNPQMDLISYGNGALYAYDLFGAKLFEFYNEKAVFENIQIVQTSNNDFVLAYDKAGFNLEILNINAKPISVINDVTQIPYTIDLYKNGKTYLLVSGNNKLTCRELK